jgi:tRNA threonylcarbamoyladenosine biosynthesis protein TsaB
MSAHLLALDSSTDELAVAVVAGERQWSRVVPGGAQTSTRIIGLALEGLAACGSSVQQVDAVAFGAGPGAFTGLRCACAVAQGLAFGAGKPVLPIDSLMIVAQSARAGLPPNERELWVAMDARMDEIYAARYRHGGDPGDHWQVISAPALYTLDALAECWRAEPPRAVAGNAIQVFGSRLPLHGAVVCAARDDRAQALLRLAQHALANGAALDPEHAAPVYLRDKVAWTTAERAARQAAATGSP